MRTAVRASGAAVVRGRGAGGAGGAGAGGGGNGGVCVLSGQRRHASRWSMWARHRNMRNNSCWAKGNIPVMFQEDTQAVTRRYVHLHWHFELKNWRRQFRQSADRKISKVAAEKYAFPFAGDHGRIITQLFALYCKGAQVKRAGFDYTRQDNPFTKETSARARFEKQVDLLTGGSKVSRMMAAGVSKKDAERTIRERWAKHRQGLPAHKKMRDKIRDWQIYGVRSVFAEEIEKLMSKLDEDTDLSGSTGIPKGVLIEWEKNEDTGAPKKLPTPKKAIGFQGFNPLIDMNAVPEIDPVAGTTGEHGQPAEHLPESVSGRSQLRGGAASFAFPVQATFQRGESGAAAM